MTRLLLIPLIAVFSSLSFAQVGAPPRDGAYQGPAPQITLASIVGTYTGSYASPHAETSGMSITSRIVVDKGADPGKIVVQYTTLGTRFAQGPCPGTGTLKGMDLEIRVPSSTSCDGRVLNLKVGATALAGTMLMQGSGLINVTFAKSAPAAKP